MLKHILMIIMTVGILMGSGGGASARISQPDVVYHGTVISAAVGSIVNINLTGSSASLATGTVGADRKYQLRVMMDFVDPRVAGTAREGDTADIFVNGVKTASVVIPKYGTIVLLDLGARTAEQWVIDHPGDDGSGDMNRNGITDLNEYLSGKDPAGCAWTDADPTHAETTVYHTKVLASCLSDAGSDGKHNLIRVARGTYAGNFSYKAGWNEDFALTLTGGYDPAGTLQLPGERLADPTATILDGDIDADQVGNGVVLAIDTNLNKTAGTVHIESLTFKNGKAPTGQNGGAIQAKIYKGDLEVVGNIFSSNSAENGGAIFAENSSSALVLLVNNVLYANNASTAAAVYTNSTFGGSVTLLNNTIVDNAATIDGNGRSIIIKTNAASNVDMTNNIISGFASVIGKDIYISNTGNGSPVIISNSLDVSDLLVNTPGFVADPGNTVCATQFMLPATGNYRLGALSACIDKGTAHLKLPATDADGSGRISGALVDIGAYEYLHDPVTKPATAVTANSATLNGVVNAKNADSTVRFEYGTTTAYGTVIDAQPSTVNGSTDTNVSAAISGLIPGATYHFRVSSESIAGTVYGSDLSFTTILDTVTLTISFVGSGGNKVESTLPDNRINCIKGNSSGCSAIFTVGTPVTLTATADWKSEFKWWSGNVVSGIVTMDADKTVGATFDPKNRAKNMSGGSHASIQDAYDAAAEGDTIQAQTYYFMEPQGLMIGSVTAKTVTIKGGYDDENYTTSSGMTSVQGPVKIQGGRLNAERLNIR